MPIDPLLFKYKGNRCANCGMTVDEMWKRFGVVNKVFQFHHIDPTKKDPNYNNIIQRELSPEQLDEVDKCVLLCNICHDVLHAQKGTATVNFRLRIGDRVVTQQMKGQMILNFETKALQFFSDEDFLLDPYLVRSGESPPVILTALELNDGLLLELVLQTRKNEKLTISRRDKIVMIKASKLTNKTCRVDWNVECPLFKFVSTDDDGNFQFAIRNSQMIYHPKHASGENPIAATGMVGWDVTYAVIRKGLRDIKAKKKSQ
jgi:hypothetical protein